MSKVKQGDTVKIHYTAKMAGGNVFDTSRKRDPLEFKVGEGKVIKGIEEAVLGMNEGEKKTVTVPQEKAYGSHKSDMVIQIPRSRLPNDLEPSVGQLLEVHHPDGNSSVVTVTEVSDDSVTLDANHPLAGKELTFDIEIMEVT